MEIVFNQSATPGNRFTKPTTKPTNGFRWDPILDSDIVHAPTPDSFNQRTNGRDPDSDVFELLLLLGNDES